MEKFNLSQKLTLFDEYWTPKIVAELNGQQVKLAKLKGELVWHSHEEEDELFLVLHGRLTLRLRDREVVLDEGDCFVVPRGVEHLPIAEPEAHVLLFEPASTLHTGEVRDERTVDRQEHI